MNIDIVKGILFFGGILLLADGVASLIVFRKQEVFNQIVRFERTMFAILLIIGGVYL